MEVQKKDFSKIKSRKKKHWINELQKKRTDNVQRNKLSNNVWKKMSQYWKFKFPD